MNGKSLLAGSLLLLSPACKQTPPPPAATAEAAPKAPKPRSGDPCDKEAESIELGPEEYLQCSKGHWKHMDAGFVGVARAGRVRGPARRLRA